MDIDDTDDEMGESASLDNLPVETLPDESPMQTTEPGDTHADMVIAIGVGGDCIPLFPINNPATGVLYEMHEWWPRQDWEEAPGLYVIRAWLEYPLPDDGPEVHFDDPIVVELFDPVIASTARSAVNRELARVPIEVLSERIVELKSKICELTRQRAVLMREINNIWVYVSTAASGDGDDLECIVEAASAARTIASEINNGDN